MPILGRKVLQASPPPDNCLVGLNYSTIYVQDGVYYTSTVSIGAPSTGATVSAWNLGVTLGNGRYAGPVLANPGGIDLEGGSWGSNQPVFISRRSPLPGAFIFVENAANQGPGGGLLLEPITEVALNDMSCFLIEANRNSTCASDGDGRCEETWNYCCEPISCTSDSEALTLDAGWQYPEVFQGADTPCESGDTGWIVGVACGVAALVLLVVGVWYWRRCRWMYLKSLEEGAEEEEEVPEDVHDLPWYVSIHNRLGTTVPQKKGDDMASRDHTVTSSMGMLSIATLNSEDRRVLNGIREITILGYSGVEPLHGEEIKMVRSPSVSWPTASESTAPSLPRSNSWDGTMDVGLGEDVIGAANRISMIRAGANAWASGGSNGGLGSGDSGQGSRGSKGRSSTSKFMPSLGILEGVDLNIPSKAIEATLGKILGEGSFGAVYKGKYRGRDVAVKKVGIGKSMTRDQLLIEIGLAARFDSDRLVKIHGASLDNPQSCYIVMELLTGGDLDARIHGRKRRRMTYIEILQAAQDIAEGLSFLHPLVIHRDLKPGNILIDGQGRMKIADFGLSRERDIGESYFKQTEAGGGTMMYMAPEEWGFNEKIRGISEKADVYALALIINEMLTRKRPWRVPPGGYAFACIAMELQEGKRPWIDPQTPVELQNLIKRMWSEDPHRRPSASDVVKILERMIEQELDRVGFSMERSHEPSIDTEFSPGRA